MRSAWLVVALLGCGRIGFDGQTPDATAGDAAASSLLLHFTFDPAVSVTSDRSGRGYDATCTSCPASVRDGNADVGDFMNTTCMEVADRSELHPTTFTYAVWARPRTLQYASIFSRPFNGTTDYSNTLEFFIENVSATDMQWIVQINSNQFQVGLLPEGVWHHVAATYDGTTFVGFIDGNPVVSDPQAPPLYAEDATLLGCDHDAGGIRGYFDGLIDDIRFYNRALSAAEVAALAAAM